MHLIAWLALIIDNKGGLATGISSNTGEIPFLLCQALIHYHYGVEDRCRPAMYL